MFETERLVVRPWRENEASLVLDMYGRDEVWQWLGASPRPTTTLDEANERLARWAGLADDPFGVWAIALKGSDEPVGTMLLLHLPDADGTPTDDIEVGWHLHPDHWGHGYATEAARGVLDHARASGITRVVAVVRPDNARSIAVTRRLGMTPVGRTDKWYGVELEAFETSLT